MLARLSEDQSITVYQSIGFAGTNGEAKRLMTQGGVQLNGEKVAPDATGSVSVATGDVLSSGRRKFVRLIIS